MIPIVHVLAERDDLGAARRLRVHETLQRTFGRRALNSPRL